jgi:hypothetical protein
MVISDESRRRWEDKPESNGVLTIVLLPRIHPDDAPLVRNLIFSGNRILHQAALAATHETLEVDVILSGSPDVPLDLVAKKNKNKLERVLK